jgi:hypothetical protein
MRSAFICILVWLTTGCSDASLKTFNSSPTATINSHADDQELPEEDTTKLFGKVADSNNRSSDLMVNWYINSEVACRDLTPDGSGYTECDVTLSLGNQTILLEVSDPQNASGNDAVTINVTRNNTPPTIERVEISPDPATAFDGLTCSTTGFSDADGDADRSVFEWTVNDAFMGTGAYLSDGYGARDVVTCTVTPSDGLSDGLPMSDSITIANTAPSVGSVAVSPKPASVDDDITCTYSEFNDPDGDPDQSVLVWLINDLPAPTSSGTLTEGFVRGDEVTCVITPFDGEAEGSIVTDSVTIQNTPPSILAVTISPEVPRVSDALTCSYSGFTDRDGDDDTSTYSWMVNGTEAGTGPLLSEGYVGGDEVQCTVTPRDGTDAGLALTDTIIVENTPPSVFLTQITPASGVTPSTELTCEAFATDADGDTPVIRFEWLLLASSGDIVSIGTGSTIALSLTEAEVGDAVQCTATATDSLGSSATGYHVVDIEGGASLRFDDDGDSVLIPSSDAFIEPVTELTFETWVKWSGSTDQLWYPIATQGWGDSMTARFFLGIAGDESESCGTRPGAGHLHVEIHTAFSFGPCVSSDVAMTPDTWHHVAMVFDEGQARLYMDGDLTGTNSVSDPTLHDALPSSVLLGRMEAGGGFSFSGALSSARYSSTARYTDTFTPSWPLESDSTTIGLWLLDDETSMARDSSEAGHDGTVYGAEWVSDTPF